MTRTYDELISIELFNDRLEYCLLHGRVSELTFGEHRYLNQTLYHLPDWKTFRRDMIIRDKSCDLAHANYEINRVYLHHLNPITVDDVVNRRFCVFDPNNVVCVSFDTHQYIHYGVVEIKQHQIAQRKPDDMIPWR